MLNPSNPLAQPSRQGAARIKTAEVVEFPHLNHGVLDVAADELAEHIDRFLDRP